jgi:hypothetical protein
VPALSLLRRSPLASSRLHDHVSLMGLRLAMAIATTLAVLAWEQAVAQTPRPQPPRPQVESYDRVWRELSRPKYSPNPRGDLPIRRENESLRERLLGQSPIGGSLRR